MFPIRSCIICGERELVRGGVVAERMENEEIRRDERPSSLSHGEANVSIPLAFHHPSGRYRKVAVVAAVVVAFGSFFLSMRGEEENRITNSWDGVGRVLFTRESSHYHGSSVQLQTATVQ